MNSSKNAAHQEPDQSLDYVKKKSFGYGYGYYFKPLQDYRSGKLSRTEVELFEYLIGLNDYYLREGHTTFYHSYSRMHIDTGIAVTTLKSIVAKFETLGLLTTGLTTQYGRKVTTFQVDHLKIVRKRRLIFGSPADKTPEALQRIHRRLFALAKMYVMNRKLSQPKPKWSGY